MRIYLSCGLPKILDESNLIKHIINYREVFSQDGIFRIQNDRLFQLLPEDKAIETFILDGRKFVVDKGGLTQKKNVQTLPYNHIIREIEQIEYKFDNKSLVALIVIRSKNKVVDMYFTTKSNNVCNNVKNNIREYVALLDIS
jgi:hypothetical protein